MANAYLVTNTFELCNIIYIFSMEMHIWSLILIQS